MKRVKLTIAYDGTNYHGWQTQPNGISIEAVLNQALSSLLKEEITVIGASRTDSGVHALGNVAVFDTENRMEAEKICFALNQRLPEDIRIQSSKEVPPDWHPRKQNCRKTYEYKILNRKIDMPINRLYTYFCYFPINVEKMRQGAACLIGEHDFKSFCTVRSQAEETVRTIYQLDIERDLDDVITIRICGNGFLYNMVRIIAGTLLRVGTGLYPPQRVKEILNAKNRQSAGPTAPAKGLTLVKLDYDREQEREIIRKNEDWEYQLIQAEIPEKKKAYLFIRYCRNEEFNRLLTRVTHQAVRNGAKEVFVCDQEKEGRIMTEKPYGYYLFHYHHDMLLMKKKVPAGNSDLEKIPIGWRKVEDSEVSLFCRLYNQVFYSLPNSATMTPEEVRKWMADSRQYLFFIQEEEQILGFLIVIDQEKELEIDSLGILEEYRRKGLAKRVMQRVEIMAETLGKEILSLGVSSINIPAFSLYKDIGFSVDKVMSRWYRTEDAYPLSHL